MRDHHVDCRYWGLTTVQCMRYHGRLSRYWADRSVASAAEATRLGGIATRLAYVALALLVGAVLIQVLAAVLL